MAFHDRARVHVEAGRGGDGALSFRREKYVPRGGPDGGDGGAGGDVVLTAEATRRDLSAFRSGQRLKARRGQHGRGATRNGAAGDDLELRVPVGTQVIDEDGEVIADLAHEGARAVVAAGGAGGRGNRRFATPTRRAPRFAETGLPGEEHWIELRLKLLVDAALVGLPNAGKSSLLRRISNAKPKVADYPFTTLAPVLGTVDGPEGRQLTVADVPGLIEGASEGAGLGHEFLAHLERARLLVHVIDAAAAEPPEERFATIDAELSAYGAGLDERPQVVVLNKVDAAPDASFEVRDPRVVAVVQTSAVTGKGIDELKRALFEHVPAGRPEPAEAESELADYLVYRPRPSARRAFRILRTDRGFRVVGKPPGGAELEAALRAAGAKAGAQVEVGARSSRARMTKLFGGAFDPPHNGHVALVLAALEHFRSPGLVVLVSARPAHRRVHAPVEIRLRLARAAFADLAEVAVELDEHERTVDLLREGRWEDPLFLVGADELAGFQSWKEPQEVLRLARIGVATRPGYPRERLDAVLRELGRPDRVELFEMPPVDVSASEVRRRAAAGESIDELVPPAVAELVSDHDLYRRYTEPAIGKEPTGL